MINIHNRDHEDRIYLLGGHDNEILKIDTTVRELAESTLLLELSSVSLLKFESVSIVYIIKIDGWIVIKRK